MPSTAVAYDGRERRQHPRYGVSKDVFACMEDNGEKMGRVVDISLGGISFLYLEEKSGHAGSASIDVYSSRESVMLEKVPARAVSDFAVDEDIPFTTIPVRRRGLQFQRTDARQRRMIEHFLEHHTVSAAS